MKHTPITSYLFVIASLLLALVLAACGGGGSSATAIPTSTIIPTYSFMTQTPVNAIETAVATKAAAAATSTSKTTGEATSEATIEATVDLNVTLDPDLVARGKGRYEALQCASCHGANGEGTSKGSSLITYAKNEGDFIAFMRSGGTIGASHQFATNRLSITGGAALYQYLLSLRKSS